MAQNLEIFLDSKSYTFLNPRLQIPLQNDIFEATKRHAIEHHIWLASSGTENFKPNTTKLVGLSKQAFLKAAQSVCSEFSLTAKDACLNVLPLFHVGGLATLARSVVSGCSHFQWDAAIKWNANTFCEQLNEQKVTVTSLVPTQIFDILKAKVKAPQHLRIVFVGGGALSTAMSEEALRLGWCIVHTYGMTETAAMMAHGKDSSQYQLLTHIKARTSASGHLEIQSDALLSGYIFVDSQTKQSTFVDPKNDGWYTSGDLVVLNGTLLQIKGRESELVKIKGESVSLLKINLALQNFCNRNHILTPTIVLAMPDARDGFSLQLVTEKPLSANLLSAFNSDLLPFERISKVTEIEKIPLTALGKVDISATKALLKS